MDSLEDITPLDQTTPYKTEQIDELSAYITDVMTMPPVLVKYQKKKITDKAPILMQIMPENLNFSQKRAQAVLAAEMAGVGAYVDVAARPGLSPLGCFPRDHVFIGPGNIVYNSLLLGEQRIDEAKKVKDEAERTKAVTIAKIIVNNMRERRDVFLNRLKENCYINIIDVNANFEGGTVVVDAVTDKILIGQMANQTDAAFEQTISELGKALGKSVVGLPYGGNGYNFFHLDLYLGILPRGEVLFYEDGTTKEGIKRLRDNIDESRIITLSKEDGLNYATNIKAIGHNLFITYASQPLQTVLEEKGYKLITPEKVGLSKGDWLIREGGPHCMTQGGEY
jgi:N-dimethylarginine dimethylaminohydrolase